MGIPNVLSESKTLAAALSGKSIARYGDGELRLAVGGRAKAQGPNVRLREELMVLLTQPSNVLVCVPNFTDKSPKAANWVMYRTGMYAALYTLPVYGSAFITRPDSAPWIDTPEFWSQVRSLWAGKHITLVRGENQARSLHENMMQEAQSIRVIEAACENAYDEIDQTESMIMQGPILGPVIMCLGPTATVLAARLARRNVHAIDMGHVGMFMRRFGV